MGIFLSILFALLNMSSTTFVGSTPCGKNIKPIRSMDTSDCEFAKWTLVIDDLEKGFGKFKLHCVYGMTVPGTPNIRNGGSVCDLQGSWALETGIAGFAGAQVIRLDPDNGAEKIRFLKLNEKLIRLLDSEKRLMIGTPAWSFTLNAR